MNSDSLADRVERKREGESYFVVLADRFIQKANLIWTHDDRICFFPDFSRYLVRKCRGVRRIWVMHVDFLFSFEGFFKLVEAI